jgi:ribonucleotide reductase beta subunit family protein with ferritin-like domain
MQEGFHRYLCSPRTMIRTVCAAGRGKTNFFEKRVGEYQKASIMSSLNGSGDHHVFRLDEDF